MTNSKKSAPTRILILSDYLLFERGLINLINRDKRFEIIEQTIHPEQAIEQIETLQPDIIILDQSGASNNGPGLQQLLKVNPVTTVIELSLNDNRLYVYQAAQHEVTEVKDLTAAINQAVV